MALTDLEIRKLPVSEKQYKRHDAHGLYLLVLPSGGKSSIRTLPKRRQALSYAPDWTQPKAGIKNYGQCPFIKGQPVHFTR